MRSVALLVVVLLAAHAVELVQSQVNVSTCKPYDNGILELKNGEYDRALSEFVSVASACLDPRIKAEASLKIGQIYVSRTPPDPVLASAYMKSVYDSRYAPVLAGATILEGRIKLALDRSMSAIEAATNLFSRARDISLTGSPTIAEASYYSGEARRLGNQNEEALAHYRSVLLKHPGTIWAAKALLGSARCYVRKNQIGQAIEALQLVRRRFSTMAEAHWELELALDWNTILYRLHMRGENRRLESLQPAPAIRTEQPPFRDGVGVLVDDRRGRIAVAHLGGWAVFTHGQRQDFTRDEVKGEYPPVDVALAPDGAIAFATEYSIKFDRADRKEARPPVPKNKTQSQPAKIAAFVSTWRGEWLVADEETGKIYRFPSNFSIGLEFSSFRATRMAVSDIDDVALLDKNKKSVVLVNHEGTVILPGIPSRAPKVPYELRDPVAIAFDPLANIYVLDKKTGTVLVFDPAMDFITTFILLKGAATEKDTQALSDASALAIDRAGRLHVFDSDAKRLRVYR